MEQIQDGIKLEVDGEKALTYDFKIPKDMFMNANDFGYARTWRQQCFINHKRNENKKALVLMGRDVAYGDNCPKVPLSKAFVLVECLNLTEQRFDPTNFSMTVKHLEDGMVQDGVFIDDNASVIVGHLFKKLNEEHDRDNYKIRMTVYRLNDAGDDNATD